METNEKEALDKEGRSESDFLAEYDRETWDRPALTADVVLFSIDGENKPVVLLVKRGGHPFLGCWAFPGGFVNPDESSEKAACRELAEETGISGVYLDQLYTVTTPSRDPRGWTASVCYMAVMERGFAMPQAGDDAAEAEWFNIDYVRSGSDYILKLSCGQTVLKAELIIKRDKMGNIDVNESKVTSCDGIAFDHAKLLLYAIERL